MYASSGKAVADAGSCAAWQWIRRRIEGCGTCWEWVSSEAWVALMAKLRNNSGFTGCQMGQTPRLIYRGGMLFSCRRTALVPKPASERPIRPRPFRIFTPPVLTCFPTVVFSVHRVSVYLNKPEHPFSVVFVVLSGRCINFLRKRNMPFAPELFTLQFFVLEKKRRSSN